MSGPKVTRPIPATKPTKSPKERQEERREIWADKQLKRIGKAGALGMLKDRPYRFTPFEMRLLLEPEESGAAAEARLAHVAHAVDSIRNMLIVVPLTLTWLSLALAGAAYQQSLTAKQSSGEPFLQQWQEGFPNLKSVSLWIFHINLVNGHRHWFTFAGFALLDASLLALLLLLTIVGQVFDYAAYRRGTRLSDFLERRLHDLNRKSLVRMTQDPEKDMPPWLSELREQIGQLGGVIGRMNSAIDTSLSSFTGAIDAQQQAVQQFLEDSRKVRNTVRQLNEMFQLGVEAQRVYKQNIPYITRDFEKMAQSQQTSAESFRAMTAMMAKTMEYLALSVNRLPEAQRIITQYQSVVAPPPPPRASRRQYTPPPPRPPVGQSPLYSQPMAPPPSVASDQDDADYPDDVDSADWPDNDDSGKSSLLKRVLLGVGAPVRRLRRRGK